MNPMHDLLQGLANKHLTLGTVESMTGGLFAAEATSIPGASHVFKGSIVTYSNQIKTGLVGVSPATIQVHGVVSDAVAKEMARLGRQRLGVDVCISVTGNAGPTAEPGKAPVGEVHLALATKKAVWAFGVNCKGDRESIRKQAVDLMVQFGLSMFRPVERVGQFPQENAPKKLMSAQEINELLKDVDSMIN